MLGALAARSPRRLLSCECCLALALGLGPARRVLGGRLRSVTDLLLNLFRLPDLRVVRLLRRLSLSSHTDHPP